MKALFVGRFQPFHNGHMEVIREILRDNNSLTIVIAGPEKPDEKNPFTFGERREMIRKALDKKGMDYEIREIHDVNDDNEWNEKIRNLGKFDVAYSRNPWTIKCLKKAGIPVKKHGFYERWKKCGRVIRERISEGKEWKDLVPKEVYDYLKGINGEEKIRSS